MVPAKYVELQQTPASVAPVVVAPVVVAVAPTSSVTVSVVPVKTPAPAPVPAPGASAQAPMQKLVAMQLFKSPRKNLFFSYMCKFLVF
jgi:hypothetical protein